MKEDSKVSVDWLRVLIPISRREPFHIPASLSTLDRDRLFEPILAHIDVHLAEGNRQAAGELLRLAFRLFHHDQERYYKIERKYIRWLEGEGRQGEAIYLLQQLLDRYNKARKTPQRTAELTMELGIVLDRYGQKDEALLKFREAIKRYKRLRHAYNKAAAMFNAASVLYDMHRYDESIKICLKALEEGGAGHLDLETHVALQLANSYESLSATSEARDWYQNAADGYHKLNNRKQESDILYRLGWMAMKKSQAVQAQTLLQRALELKRELDYGTGLALYHLHRAEACRGVGLSKKALSHYRTCLSLATILGNDSLASRARFGLYRACAAQNPNLPGFMKLPPAPGAEAVLTQGRGGIYSEQAYDGARTGVYRESGRGDQSLPDRTYLARLLEDLARVRKVTGTEGHEFLYRQGKSVASWQGKSKRKG